MLFLAGVSATYGVASIWGQHLILDEDTWVATSKALVNDPTIQRDVASIIVTQIVDAVGFEKMVQSTLPPPFNFLSGTIAEKTNQLLVGVAVQVVKTDAFIGVWDSAVRAVHEEFVHNVDGSSTVTTLGSEGISLNVGPALDLLKDRLSSLGIPLLDNVDVSAIPIQVLLVNAPGLERIRTWVNAMRIGAIVFPAIAVIAGLVALLVARRRSLAIIAGGSGAIAGAAVVAVVVAAGKQQAIDRISGGVLGASSATIVVDKVISGLTTALLVSAVVGGSVIVGGIIGAVVFGRAASTATDPEPESETAM